jgi:lysophospholipase L1-like esterase
VNLAALAAVFLLAADPQKSPFEFADGDRVVFLGGTLIEREQKYGYWELALSALVNKARPITYRNLGWSGDTVWCESRGSFDGPKKGYENTIALVKELKPTVIVLCYGHVESFDGEAGVKRFTEGLEKLIDGVSVTKARVILISPTPFENVKPMTDADKKNDSLKLYVAAMKGVAEKRKLEFVDLFGRLVKRVTKKPFLTTNGIHLDEEGYVHSALSLIDDREEPPGAEFLAGMFKIPLDGIEFRSKVIAKNELFFHRWRPQNQTYLFGFRKHEQGNNAKEVAEFDPLVEKAEKEIAEFLKKPK